MIYTLLFFLMVVPNATAQQSYFDKTTISHINSRALKMDNPQFYLNFKSKQDNTVQPVLFKLPEDYDPNTPWPLLVVLHGRGDGPIIVDEINSMVQVGPFARGDKWYKGKARKDVYECMEIAKELFNIDPNRIYLTGFSMGATGVFEITLKNPDRWAACVPVCGRLYNTEKIINASNVPMQIIAGTKDHIVGADCSRNAYLAALENGIKCWQYIEYDMGHSFSINWKSVEKWLLDKTRKTSPKKITFHTDKPAKIYWIELLRFHQGSPAYIRATIDHQTINIETENVKNYRIDLKSLP